MRLFFLLPLTTGLISGYLCKKSADEMAYLTGTATVVSLILTLVLAPWQIQLLILGVTIFVTRKLLLKNASKSESNSIAQSDRAQIETSGVSTENDASSEIRGMYRGAPWISDRAKTPAPQPNPANLKYRGASGKNSDQ
jgi:membrane protein implicated in regulation of membrane protease activity